MKPEKCLKCGKAIPEDSRTCPDCYGKDLPDKFEKKELEPTISIFVVIAFIVVIIIEVWGGLSELLYLTTGGFGLYLASWYAKNNKENTFTKCIALANLITWLYPPAAGFTIFASFKLSETYGKKSSLYLVMAIIGTCLTVIYLVLIMSVLSAVIVSIVLFVGYFIYREMESKK